MKKIERRKWLLFALASVLMLGIIACAKPKKTLVVYFSATGQTEAAAQRIATALGAEIQAIVPEQLYTPEDLDWRIPDSRNQIEEHDRAIRPAILPMDLNTEYYDTIYIGYPIWAGEAPRVINTFVEAYNLKGIVLKPFCTSGMTPVDKSVDSLRATYPDLLWQDGLRMNDVSEEEFNAFISKTQY